MEIKNGKLSLSNGAYKKLSQMLWRQASDAERERDHAQSWWDSVRIRVELDQTVGSVDLSATVIRSYRDYLNGEELERISIEVLWVEGWSADGEAIGVDFDPAQLECSRIDVGYRLKCGFAVR